MNIVNTMLWMKKNAYEETTIRKVAKLLRHLQRNCNTKDPEIVKLYIAEKTTSNGHKENLVEAYAIHLRSQNLTWEQPFYQRYDKKRRPPKEELIDFLIKHARAVRLTRTFQTIRPKNQHFQNYANELIVLRFSTGLALMEHYC